MKRVFTLLLPSVILFMSCKKTNVEANANRSEVDISASSEVPTSAIISYPFIMHSTGPFTISPVAPTIVKINQLLTISAFSPFTLTAGVVTGYDDLTIPTFPERFFDGSFRLSGQGNDSLFATVTVQTSVFSDPIDPQSGDFFGSEDFTGTITITGGTGHYLQASGSGTYSAHSEWRPPVQPGTIFSGTTTVNGVGNISVRARSGRLESSTHQ
jgi:hypothetical protein